MFVLLLAWCVVNGSGCRDELWPKTFPSIEACWTEAQKQVKKPLANDLGEELIGARCIDREAYEKKDE